MSNSNSNKQKSTWGIFRRLGAGFAALATLLAVGTLAARPQKAERVNAEEVSWTPNEREKATEFKDIAVTASSSTLTTTAQSISVTFRSKKVSPYANGASYKNVYVLPYDEAFDRAKAKAEYDALKEQDPDAPYLQFDGYVYNISYNKSAPTEDPHKITIPSTVSNNYGYTFLIKGIAADCCFSKENGLVSYANITEIFIPKTIETIADGAFYDVPETVTISCEAPEYTENDDGDPVKTYPNDWTDCANVLYGRSLSDVYCVEIDDDEADRLLNTSSPAPDTKNFGVGADFYLGIENPHYNLPLYMEYQFEKLSADGETFELQPESHMYKIPISSTNNPYDAIGTKMGVDYISKDINIEVPANCRINSDSIRFHNIFPAIENDEKSNIDMNMVPDFRTDEPDGWDGSYYCDPTIAYSLVPHFEEFFSIQPVSLATLGNHLQFEVEIDKNLGESGYGIYERLEPNIYRYNKSALDSGLLKVRYQFASLDQANYRFTYDDNGTLKTTTLRIRTPVKYVLVEKDKNFRMGFLIDSGSLEGITMESLRKVEFCNFVIKSDLYNTDTHAIVTKSTIALHFAFVTLFDDVPSAKKANVGVVLVSFAGAYVVIFAILAVAYFFYAKRRFRNDEFRRVNNKKFVLHSLKNFLGFGIVTFAFLFIYCRWGLLRTTVVTYNPLDAFVILFSVVGLIFLGFTIKNMVVSFKAARKRKEAIRLRLDEDVVDDGTH